MRKLLTLVNAILFLASVGLVVWLVRLNLPPAGQLVVESNFLTDQPALSRITPLDRVRIIDGNVLVAATPVYFDLRIPSWYDQAKLTIEYKPNGLTLRRVGIRVGEGFAYDLKEPEQDLELADGWRKAEFTFALGAFSPKNVSRFTIEGAPTVKEGGMLLLGKLIITAQR